MYSQKIGKVYVYTTLVTVKVVLTKDIISFEYPNPDLLEAMSRSLFKPELGTLGDLSVVVTWL